MNWNFLTQVWASSASSIVVVALILPLAIARARQALDKPFQARRVLGRELDAFTGFPQEQLELIVRESARHALRGWRAWAAIYAPLLGGWAMAILASSFLRLAENVPHRELLSCVAAALCAGGGVWAGSRLQSRFIRADWRRYHPPVPDDLAEVPSISR